MDECLYYYPLWETTLGGDWITLMCFASVLFTHYSIFFSVLHLTVLWQNSIYNKPNATFWVFDKKDHIHSRCKEFAICISLMAVKILEKPSVWQADRFRQGQRYSAAGRVLHGPEQCQPPLATPQAPPRHAWSSAQQGPRLFPPPRPFPPTLGLLRRVGIGTRCTEGSWAVLVFLPTCTCYKCAFPQR